MFLDLGGSGGSSCIIIAFNNQGAGTSIFRAVWNVFFRILVCSKKLLYDNTACNLILYDK